MDKKKGVVIIISVIIGLLIIFLFSGKDNLVGKTVFDMWAALSVSIQVTTAVPNITTEAPTTATEDIEYLYDVNASGKDLKFSVNSSGLFGINSNTGLIKFTPKNGQDGSYNINISVNDNNGQTSSQSYTLVISAVNDAPELDHIGDLTGETGSSNTYTVKANDEEGNTLTFSIPDKNSSLSMTINSNTGVITIPSGNDAGDYAATIRVSDGTSNDDENITAHIITSNSAPTILTENNSIDGGFTSTIREDQEINFNLTFNDNDGNNTVSVGWYQKNGSLKDFDFVKNDDNYTFVGVNGTNAGTYTIYASVSDGIAKVNSSFWNLTVTRVIDTDGDGVSDYTDNCKFMANANQADSNSNGRGDACEDDFDGDGVADSNDFIDGGAHTIKATSSSGDAIALTFKIDNSDNINISISGTKPVILSTTTADPATGLSIVEPLIEFNHNFGSTTKLDLSNFSLKEETRVVSGESKSAIVISGISLASGENKTVYFDILLDKNGVCIKDEETLSINEISTGCTGSGEKKIGCDGSDQSGFTCEKNSTLNKYKITGLTFSSAEEQACTESWSCTAYSACSGGTQTRTCTDSNNCGTQNNKPAESQSCGVTGAAVSGSAEAARGGGEKPSLVVDQDLIKVLVKKGSSLRKSISIKNNGDTELTVSIDLQNLKDVLSIRESIFKLKPREEKIVDLNILTGAGVAPGVYIGDILVKAGDILKLIKAIIEIESERILFDVSLDIPLEYKTVNPGDEFRVQSTLLNLGGLQNVDVLIEYTIKNSKGDIILKEEETVSVGKQASFTKKFKLPDDLPLGEYVISAVVKYGDSVGTSSETFNVGGGESTKGLGAGNIIILAIILIAVITAIVLERKGLKKIEKKLVKKTEKKSTLKPEERKALLEELKTLTTSYNAGYITKDVFEKSKKKIEELLNK